MTNSNEPTTRTPLPDSVWDPDTRRVLARKDESAAYEHDYATLLAEALATPSE